MTRIALICLLLLAATALAAYSLSRNSSLTPADPNQTTIRVSNWGGPASDPVFLKTEREILDEFHRTHPHIRVQIDNIPGQGVYLPKLLMSFVAGNPPDVVTLDASSAAVFINSNLLADLTPLYEADASFHLDDFFPNVLDIARRGPQLFAIPLDFTPMVILYNRKIFDEAKIPYPKPGWTRDEFLQAAKALTIPSPDQRAPIRYGFCFQKEMPAMPLWFPMIWANGGDVLSPDGLHAVGYFDSPPTLDAIQFIVDLAKKHRAAPTLAESTTAGVDLFRAGRAAMTLTGHWSLIEYRVDKIDLGVAPLPPGPLAPHRRHSGATGGLPASAATKPAPDRTTIFYAAALAISRTSPHQPAAWEYINFMTSAQVQKKRVATGVAISGNRIAAQSFAGDPVEDAFLNEVPYARPPWGTRVERYELVDDLGREMIEDIFNSNIPVPEAVSKTAALVEGALNRQ